MPTRFTIQHNDIANVASDLLLLKHAMGFHGADLVMADRLIKAGLCKDADISPALDQHAVIQPGKVIAPSRVMFVGTPHLRDFSYGQMRHFATRAIELLAAEGRPLTLLTTTVHGVNYGLDASEALQYLVQGFQDGLRRYPEYRIEEISFVEKSERVARILKTALEALQPPSPVATPKSETPTREPEESRIRKPIEVRQETPTTERPVIVTPQPAKKHVFVAMPFSEEFQDIYEFGIYGAVRKCGFICERVDEPLFTGDILRRITDRISSAEFVIAELTGARANVYLEVGYAWGKDIPVITLAREGEKLHFDVSTHRCIFYRTIGQLARELEKLVRSLYGR